ncbi:glycosyltransferase family 4 protein [bacterium SCSIO 12696]|nr:glycosyltransferase family 4 protein [bacterium SCSIO 12696]
MTSLNAIKIPDREPINLAPGGINIGIVSPCYGLEKVSYALKPDNYNFYKLRTVPWEGISSRHNFYENNRILLPTRTDLIHTFNKVPMNGPPFIVSFELEFPRHFGPVKNWQTELTRKALRSDRCTALLGLSDSAAKLAIQGFEAAGEYEIAKKIRVFRGGISSSTIIDTPPKPPVSNRPLQLLFVGNDYLRKGLLACILAVENLQEKGADIELSVISSLDKHTYCGEESEESKKIMQRAQSNPWIKLLGAQPNATVKEFMKGTDMLLFPTLDESLGWVPIEAGMEGTASVCTNIFAIPESIEHEQSGLLLNVPLNSNTNRWEGINRPDMNSLFMPMQYNLAEQLSNSLEKLLNEPDYCQKLGKAAKLRMEERYSTKFASEKLSSIYESCLA